MRILLDLPVTDDNVRLVLQDRPDQIWYEAPRVLVVRIRIDDNVGAQFQCGVDPRPERLELARANALALGVPKLELIEGTAPEALTGLPRPDAVFIGGGLSRETVAAARAALPNGGRLVANTVTLDSEALLIALRGEFGGDLTRLSIERAAPVGGLTGWRPAMPVVQWSLIA